MQAIDERAIRTDERRRVLRDLRRRIKRHRETYTYLFPSDLDRIIKECQP